MAKNMMNYNTTREHLPLIASGIDDAVCTPGYNFSTVSNAASDTSNAVIDSGVCIFCVMRGEIIAWLIFPLPMKVILSKTFDDDDNVDDVVEKQRGCCCSRRHERFLVAVDKRRVVIMVDGWEDWII